MTPLQLKLGRYAVGLSVRELADIADVSTFTINRYETGKGGINHSTAQSLKATLEKRRVQFLENGDTAQGGGVCLKLESREGKNE